MLCILMILTIASFTGAVSTERSVEKRATAYQLVSTEVDWYNAKAACETQNSKLAEIRSQADLDAAIQATTGYSRPFWIGVIDPQEDNTFEYATGGALTFSNWMSNAPFVYNQVSSVVMYPGSGEWENVGTYYTFGYLCVSDTGPGVSGDPHMTTFDGRPFSFQGICWYTLFKDCSSSNPDFEVTAEFEPREDSSIQQVRTRTVSVNVTVGGDFVIINRLDVVAGRADEHMTEARPIHVHKDDKTITLTFTSKDTTFTLHWTLKKHSLRVSIDGSDYRGHLCGLLGDDDGNSRNDFLTPDGDVVYDATEFGRSWEVEGKKCD
ncbi:alpha-tectorin-like [Saccoglossus kowalevskii]|uniref:Otogelin-like n=1 Tax=Saccoglossus kowalevskii TaxID=10224 RepID=A0ABM0MF26_SACKO|nr:PREDICTED: otogelin-like [Saccoglossus kowalevskii]